MDEWKNVRYPCIGVSKHQASFTIEFRSRGVGIVRTTYDDTMYRVGYHSDGWRMSRFTPDRSHVTEQVTIRELFQSPAASPNG